jgi:hypothetical protein
MAAVGLAGLVMAGCSPRFEWRELRSPDGYVVSLPGRAQTVTRDVPLANGQSVPMTIASTGVGPTMFAVGTARLTADVVTDPAARETALSFFRDALVRNVGGTIIARSTPSLVLPPASQRRVLAAEAIEATAEIGPGKRKSRLAAHFYVVDDRLFQLVALGAEGEIPPEALDTFFTSFRLTP